MSRAASLPQEVARWCRQAAAAERVLEYPLVRYQRDPVRYVRERLRVEVLFPHQEEILRSVARAMHGDLNPKTGRPCAPRVAVRSGQKSGKTKTVIWLALWFYECFADCEVLMCAAIEEQTRGVLWKELLRTIAIASEAGVQIDGQPSRSPATGMPSSDGKRLIRSISGREVEALAGISGRQLLIVDEASHLPEAKAEAFMGNQMGAGKGEMGGCIVLISNPTANAGPFFDAFHRMQEHWQGFHVDCVEVARWQVANDVRVPFTANVEKIEEAKLMWGEDSAFYQWRVRGNFLKNEAGRIVPMVRIEGAVARWADAPEEGLLKIGWDIAGDGLDADDNAWSVVRGHKQLFLHRRTGLTEDAALAELYALLKLHRLEGETPHVLIDAEGPIGSAYYGRVRGEKHHRDQHDKGNAFEVFPVRGSSRFVRDKTKFDRVRDELLWVLSQWMIEAAIVNDAKLQAELYAPQWEPNSNNKLVATPKHVLRTMLGRSPDSLDSLALAVWTPPRWVGADAPASVEAASTAPTPPLRDMQDAASAFDQQSGTDPWWPRSG